MEPGSEISMDFSICFISSHRFPMKMYQVTYFTFIKLLGRFYQRIQRHLIGYHHYCRRKDRRSFKLIVDRELRDTTLKLLSNSFEGVSKLSSSGN